MFEFDLTFAILTWDRDFLVIISKNGPLVIHVHSAFLPRSRICSLEQSCLILTSSYLSIFLSVCLPNCISLSPCPPTFPFWAAAPKGRCLVGHRGEFPDVRPYVRPSPPEAPLRSQISPLGPQISPLRPKIRPLRPKIRPPKPKTQPTPKISPPRPRNSSLGPKISLQRP